MARPEHVPVDALPGRPPPLDGGSGGDVSPESPLVITDITPTIPAVAAQPTTQGRKITIGPALPDGNLPVGLGDETYNSGPIDVVGFNPDTGAVTTYLPAFDTERITRYHRLNDGSLWTTSVDPRGSNPASLATNCGGTWHTVPVAVPGRPVAVHLYWPAQTSDDTLYVCGARDLTTAEGGAGYNGGNSGVAFVWKSTDMGATWTEDFASVSLTDGFWRFYEITQDGDTLHVETSDGTGYFTLTPSGWSSRNVGNRPSPYPPQWSIICDRVGDRILYFTSSAVLYDTTLGVLGRVESIDGWTGSIGLDGRIYVCDGTHVYRVET